MIVKKLELAGLCLIFALLSTGCQNRINDKNKKPNVILILTDDQGYGDMACHGNPWIKTPNMDELHSQSVCFTDFHVASTCSPTRAGIMTGKYNNKVGVWHTINGREILSSDETALPGFFKQAGYRTALFGKWHLGDNYPHRPQDFGFDEVLRIKGGTIVDSPNYWNNHYFDDTYFRNGKPEKFEGYCTDIWFSEAMKFIGNNKGRPFFCEIATNAPHGPWSVDEKYKNMYKDNPDIPTPNFYGMITNIDENLGKLRNFLKSQNIDKNTIIVFITDNGSDGVVVKGNEQIGYNAGMRGKKGSVYDGGHRADLFIHWVNGKIPEGKEISNITSFIDCVPTLLDLTGILPSVKTAFDGISLKPLIYGNGSNWPERTLFVDTQRKEHLVKWKDFAIMTDQWRLVNKTELYDIKADPGQRNNIANSHPETMKKLLEAYETWWADISVNGDQYNNAEIGSGYENPVILTTHDLHAEEGLVAYCQHMIRKGEGANGFYAVEFLSSGNYEIELARWPKESNLRMRDSAPAGKSDIPSGEPYVLQFPYPEGKALKIVKARLKIGNNEFEKTVAATDTTVKFKVNIIEGAYKMKCDLIDTKDITRSSYYVYVRFDDL